MSGANEKIENNGDRNVVTEYINVWALFDFLLSRYLIVIVVVLVSAISSVVYALILPEMYRSENLMVANEKSNSNLRIPSQLGGLASIAGMGMQNFSQRSSKQDEAIEIIQSRNFFVNHLYADIHKDIFAVIGWNKQSRSLIYDEEILALGAEESNEFGPLDLHQDFLNMVNISVDVDTGFIKLAVEHYSPIVAKKWVDLLVEKINFAIRERDVALAQNSIEYLMEKRQETSLVNIDVVFSELIEEQTQTMMLANSSNEYVFRTIDPPVVAKKRFSPNRASICIFGTIGGTVTGIVLLIIFSYVRSSYKTYYSV